MNYTSPYNLNYTAPRTRSRPGSRPLSRSGLSQTQGRGPSRPASVPQNTSRPASRVPSRVPSRARTPGFYDTNDFNGRALSGWGSVTPKPHSHVLEAYKQTGCYANPSHIRPAGGYGTQQWQPPPLRNTTSVGLVLRDTHTLHTDGSGVMVETICPNSRSAWSGFHTNDVITNVNGIPTNTVQEFYEAVAQNPQEGRLNMRLNRDGRRNLRFAV